MTMLSSTATNHPQDEPGQGLVIIPLGANDWHYYSSRGRRSDLITLAVLLTAIGASLLWGALLLLPAIRVVAIGMVLFMIGAILVVLGSSNDLADDQEADVNVELFRRMRVEATWPDPTHGQIDRDIQAYVSTMSPTSLGSRTAIENTLQTRRRNGVSVVPGPWRSGYQDGLSHTPSVVFDDLTATQKANYCEGFAAAEADRRRFVPVSPC